MVTLPHTFTLQGLHPVAVWQHGLPPALADGVEAMLGQLAVPLVWLLLASAGAVVALWQLRTWWGAQLALVR